MARAPSSLALALLGLALLGSVAGGPSPSGAALAATAERSPPAQSAQSYYPLPRPVPIPLREMRPFPVVRIVGQTTSTGARIRILSVRAPAGARIVARCRGGGCARRSVAQGRGIGRAVRFKRFERRMRAGTVIEVFVSRANVIGKFTRFRIRRGRAPSRLDNCLLPGASKGSTCLEG